MSDIITKLSAVQDVIPNLTSIEKTRGVFQTSVITYNEGTVAYSSSAVAYGGADRITGPIPFMDSAGSIVPQMAVVTQTGTVSGTVTLQAGQPMGAGFFLYLTYPETIEIKL